jgi:DNA-directed RNA polymerase specialized sigma24 family protein
MDSSLSFKKDWVITQDAFDLLLAQLDANRARAGEKYEEIRRKLVKFLKWRGCASPEEIADRTIDRVAMKIAEGAELQASHPYLFFHGVALNVLREHWREPGRESEPLEDLAPSQIPSQKPQELWEREAERLEKERRLDCLRECVRKLPRESVDLINEYHQGEGELNKERRKRLAERLKISMNTLRIRAYRIRVELERCVDGCLERQAVK